MLAETKVCQNCKRDFTIEPDDFGFYEKIKVPPPTFCPECRLQRKYAWRNERTLYRRNCDLCGQSTVSFYSPNKPLKVFCIKCWWGDKWNPVDYGRDFDFSRSFFEQFRELQCTVPRIAVFNRNNINSDFTNHSDNSKNCYLSSCCFEGEEILYSNWIVSSRKCIDCSYVYENGEMLYECVDSRKSYKCQFCNLVENCIDCSYCYDCRNCSNCFMSSNLRNKNYVFNNIQLEKEEYFSKIEEYKLDSYKTRSKLLEEFLKMTKEISIHKHIISERNINSFGGTLFNCKNARHCFDANSLLDTKYVFSAINVKSSIDLYHVGWGTELSYELHGGQDHYNCHFCNHGGYGSNLEYCDSCDSCENLFGCISVKKGKYMIFNKQYSKEEYEKLVSKIKEQMMNVAYIDKNGLIYKYGEFFPPSISPVCYNESQGNYYMPLSKEDILNKGWLWEDKVPGIFGKETISPDSLPDSIKSVDENISTQVLKCVSCSRNYNITPSEFIFYKQQNIPLPRLCIECRYKKRFAIRLPRKLWHRQCMCEKENHEHTTRCPNEFETSYAPDRPEIVYCEGCYNKEVY